MPRRFAVCGIALLSLLAACNRGGNTGASPGALPALAAYAPHRMVVTPTARVRADTSEWGRRLGSGREVGRRLDAAIAARLREIAFGAHWILADELQRAYERNRMYAADPYQLAVEPIRSDAFEAGKRYGEPLSSQLRTMIALHEDARYVLVPIELRLENARATLRAALVDPRLAEARWVGTIESDTTATEPARALTQVAERLVNLFFVP